jgi:hypothetical protein
MVGLMGSTALFVLLLVLAAGQQLHRWRKIRLSNEVLISTPIQTIKSSLLSRWATCIFVILVLYCVVVSLLSQHPAFQSPLWLSLLLQGFTYVSAFIYWISVRDGGLEEES